MARLADWDVDLHLGGHDSPAFAPNLLHLLADRGLQASDETRVERLLDQMLEHQTPSRRFMSYGTSRMSPEPVWGSLLCDTHAITEVLVRFGRAEDPRFEPRWTACAKIWCSRPRVAPGRASPTQ